MRALQRIASIWARYAQWHTDRLTGGVYPAAACPQAVGFELSQKNNLPEVDLQTEGRPRVREASM